VNRIGDAVYSLPAICALKEGFPGSRLSILVKGAVGGLYKQLPYVDEIIPIENRGRHRGVGGRLRLVREIREGAFDLAAIFHNTFETALIPFMAGIPDRIGYVKEGRGPLLTRKRPFPDEPLYQVDHYLDIVRLAGVTTEKRIPTLYLSLEEKDWAVREMGDGGERPLIALIPGSIARTRRWAPKRFAETARKLSEETGARFLIAGGPEDRTIAHQIRKGWTDGPLDFTGRTTIRQLMALLGQCDLAIANDTGPMHLAWTLGTPVVTFFGAGDVRRTGPRSPIVRILRRDLPCSPCIREECAQGTLACLNEITVDEVLSAARELLDKYPPARALKPKS